MSLLEPAVEDTVDHTAGGKALVGVSVQFWMGLDVRQPFFPCHLEPHFSR